MNPYEQNAVLGKEEFLKTFYTLLKKKTLVLIKIETEKKKKEPALSQQKIKFETTSKMLESIRLMSDMIDYTKPEGLGLFDILNDIGLFIGKGNIAETKEESLHYYGLVIIIVDVFLNPI